MTHQMPDKPINFNELPKEEVLATAQILENQADYILAFRQPHTDKPQYAIIALLFTLHPPDYVRDALVYFHAKPDQATLFQTVYDAHYQIQRLGIPAKPSSARYYLLDATKPAPHGPIGERNG